MNLEVVLGFLDAWEVEFRVLRWDSNVGFADLMCGR